MMSQIKEGDIVMSLYPGGPGQLKVIERAPDNENCERVWWCEAPGGSLFSVTQDETEEENWEELYRYIVDYDQDDYPLFKQCAYAEFYLKKKNRDWDAEDNS